MIDSLLVATDGSPDAGEAADEAIDLAARLDVPLHVIAVVESRTGYDNAIVDPSTARNQLEERASDAVTTITSLAEKRGIETTTAVRVGVPHYEILSYATDHDLGAYVVGSRGRSRFKRTLLGSTAEGVLQHADRPVIVCSEYQDEP